MYWVPPALDGFHRGSFKCSYSARVEHSYFRSRSIRLHREAEPDPSVCATGRCQNRFGVHLGRKNYDLSDSDEPSPHGAV